MFHDALAGDAEFVLQSRGGGRCLTEAQHELQPSALPQRAQDLHCLVGAGDSSHPCLRTCLRAGSLLQGGFGQDELSRQPESLASKQDRWVMTSTSRFSNPVSRTRSVTPSDPSVMKDSVSVIGSSLATTASAGPSSGSPAVHLEAA